MTDQKVPALGQAWSGNWRARVLDRARERGFSSVTAFAEAHPALSAIELAEELSTDHATQLNQSDVAADQVVTVWRDEANRDGEDAIERFARRLLVGELHRDLPGGWRSDWRAAEVRPEMSRMTALVARWSCYVDPRNDGASARVFDALLAGGKDGTTPEGWLPSTADDPVLVEIFRQSWRKTN
jgi:hypothetical protein